MALVPRFRRSRRLMLVILVAVFLLGVQGGLAVLPIQEEGDGDAGPSASAFEVTRAEVGIGSSPAASPRQPAPGESIEAVSRPKLPVIEAPAVSAVPEEVRARHEPAHAPALEPGDAPPEDPAEPGAPDQSDEPDPAEQRRRADADRLWGCVRTMAADDLQVAFEAAEAAGRLDLLPEGSQRLGAAWADLSARVRARVAAALRTAASGDMASAARALSDLASIDGPGRELSHLVVRGAAASLGVRWDPGLQGGVVDVPRPGPLPRGLEVMFDSAAGVRFEGVVRAERAGVVSVEVAGPGGRRFPTAPRSAVQPRSVTTELALDQCACALVAGERAWAVAWWTRARALGADGPRLAFLSSCLCGD
jgi:hypothetical protein